MDGLTKARIRKLQTENENLRKRVNEEAEISQQLQLQSKKLHDQIAELQQRLENLIGMNTWEYDPHLSAAQNRANLMGLIAHVFPERSKPQCGTYSGYQAHRRAGEYACGDCKAAAAAYRKQLRKQK